MKWLVCALVLSACSTTYRVTAADLERIAQGAEVQNVTASSGEAIDFSTYTFVYRSKDDKTPRRVKGIESLNGLIGSGTLTGVTALDVMPSLADHAWQRTLLGGGVGLAAGVGIGFAISNRIVIERTAQAGGTFRDGPWMIAVGTVVSAVLGAAAGALVAYFGGAGVGNVRDAKVELLGGPASLPASEPASQPAQ